MADIIVARSCPRSRVYVTSKPILICRKCLPDFIQQRRERRERAEQEEVVRVKEPRGFLVKGRRSTSAINRGGFNKVAKWRQEAKLPRG